ncbi:class I SAM-dependent methyltransferase [Candidatus Gottesmanbacteria bacterium]|nr:class I SAM-dependent methyltransferase [Candidatus Gottesmanbacteria bacterium]
MIKNKKKLTQEKAFRLGTDYQFIDSIPLGPWTSYSLLHDPIHTSFVLARYKFVARLLTGKKKVLEIGCGDAPGTPIVAQFVEKVFAIDVDDRLIDSNKKRLSKIKNIEFRKMNICEESPGRDFDAAFLVDVIEHLDKHLNAVFMKNTCRCLTKQGICIVGTPNITANRYASERSRVQHINLFSFEKLRKHLSFYFHNIFMFSMNDEVVHTGFGPMAHYLFGVGVGVK